MVSITFLYESYSLSVAFVEAYDKLPCIQLQFFPVVLKSTVVKLLEQRALTRLIYEADSAIFAKTFDCDVAVLLRLYDILSFCRQLFFRMKVDNVLTMHEVVSLSNEFHCANCVSFLD